MPRRAVSVSRACLVVAFLMGGAVHAQVTAPHWPLRQAFGKHAAVIQTSRQGVAEVCEGDDCTRFIVQGRDGVEAAHDFAFLYFWMVKNYDLAPYTSPAGQRLVEIVLSRQKGQCTGANEEAVARCVMARMASGLPLAAYVSRFDNGWRKTFPLDFRAELKRAGIAP